MTDLLARYRKLLAALVSTTITATVWAVTTGQDLSDPKTWLAIAIFVLGPSGAVAAVPNRQPHTPSAVVIEVVKAVGPALADEAGQAALSSIRARLRDRRGRVIPDPSASAPDASASSPEQD